MDYDKLIDAVKLCGSTPKIDQCKQCAYWSDGDMGKCIPKMTADAATALSTLQAENEKLRAELESKGKYYEQMIDALSAADSADLARMTAERDAAVSDVSDILAEVEEIRRGYGVDNADADAAFADLCGNYCAKCGNNCYEEAENYRCKNYEWRGIKED